MQAAIEFGKPDMLQYYINKGAKVDMPPDKVSPLYTDGTKTKEYRKSPFIIQAAIYNTTECLTSLVKLGQKL